MKLSRTFLAITLAGTGSMAAGCPTEDPSENITFDCGGTRRAFEQVRVEELERFYRLKPRQGDNEVVGKRDCSLVSRKPVPMP